MVLVSKKHDSSGVKETNEILQHLDHYTIEFRNEEADCCNDEYISQD